jgi:hypothetical protein
MMRDAEISSSETGVFCNPFSAGLLRGRTKKSREGNRRRIPFRPFVADELHLVLMVRK